MFYLAQCDRRWLVCDRVGVVGVVVYT